MEKKVVIIGAGTAGLSAGCYAAMNGYAAHIVEAHSLPGGLCTSWRRKGYLVDDSCHWLTGSGPSSPFHQVWQELGALEGRRIVDYEYFVGFTGSDGRVFRLFTDVDRLEQHMLELSPPDAAPTRDLCRFVRSLGGFSMPVGKPPELMGPIDGIRVMRRVKPYMKLFAEVGPLSAESFGARFTDLLIRDGIRNAMFGASGSLLPLVMTLGAMSRKTAGYPVGGSLALARGIEARYTALGGTVQYGARVARVLEREGRATGVALADGTEIEADYVVAACDMRSTLTGLLDGSRMDPAHRELLESGTLMDPITQVALGVDLDLSGQPAAMAESFRLPAPISIGGRRVEWFNVKNYSCDPSMAPAGRSLLLSMFFGDWPYWERLRGDPEAYRAEKERTVEACISALETRYAGIRGRIEMTDVATPLTYERYTGNWKGSYMTWLLTGEFRRRHRFIPKTVPGLEGLYLSSMWTNPPGGLPGAAGAGREVVQLLCARDRKRFVTTTP